MLRKLAVSLAVAGIISATNANALGLGEIKINSALNEPLNAEIKLLKVRKLGPLQIQPRMANIDEFALAGLEKSRFLTDVSFQVKVNPDGTGSITMRSDRPVKEPFLNFLVEVNWPNGRLVREYTLLLDPPVYDPTPVRKTVQPTTTAVAPSRSVQSQPISLPSSSTSARITGASEVYVDKKDTLWSIAIKHRPSSSVSAKKMMIALQKKNPHAFVDGNINALRAGVTLKLPTRDEIERLNSKDAALEVVRQTSEWKSKDGQAPVAASKKQPETTKSVSEQPEPKPTDEKSAELKIVTPKETMEPESGAMTDQSDEAKDKQSEMASEEGSEQVDEKQALMARNQELEDRLSQSLENVDKIIRDNEELKTQLDAILYESEKLRELLELKNNELAKLQSKVAAAEAAAVAPPPPPAPPEKSFLDSILQSPGILGGIGAALIALLGGLFFFLRRGKKDEEEGADENALVQVPEELDTSAEPETAEASEEVAEATADEVEDVAETAEASEDDLAVGEEDDLLEEDTELDLSDEDLEDLEDLDLDMDMDLDLEENSTADVLEAVEQQDPDDMDALLDDDEFDLGLDDEVEDELASDADEAIEAPVEDDVADELDAILDEPEAAEDIEEQLEELSEDEPDALDDILGEVDDTDDVDLGLDDGDLEFDLEDDASVEEVAAAPEEAEQDSSDDLDFVVDEVPDLTTDEAVDDSEPEIDLSEDEISFDVADELEVDQVEEDLDETALDDLLDSVSDDDVQSLADDAEQSDELDDLLAQASGEDQLEELAEDDSDVNDDLEALLAEDLETMDLDEAQELVDADDAEDAVEPELDDLPELGLDEDTDDALEAMLAENPEPSDLSLPGKLETQEELDEEGLDIHDDFDSLLAEVDAEADTEDEEPQTDDASDELDAMLDDLGADLDLAEESSEEEEITLESDDVELDEDLEASLDSELDALLNSDDNDLVLEEDSVDEEDASVDEDFDELAGLNLLEGADEVETKLDLARAYIDMEDLEGAKDILEEIVVEGSDEQKGEAQSLIKSIDEK